MTDSKPQAIEAIHFLMDCQQRAGDEKATTRFMPIINAIEEGDLSSALEQWQRIPGRLVIADDPNEDAVLQAAHSIAGDRLYSLVNETRYGTDPAPMKDLPTAVQELAGHLTSGQEATDPSSRKTNKSRYLLRRLFVILLGLSSALFGVAVLSFTNEPWLARWLKAGAFLGLGAVLLATGMLAKDSVFRRSLGRLPF